jgi:hypothetical protein
MDVSDLRVVEEGLKSSEAVDAIEHSGGDLGFSVLVERLPAIRVGARGKVAELVRDQLASQSPFIGWREPATAAVFVAGMRCRQLLADAVVKPGNKLRVGTVPMP